MKTIKVSEATEIQLDWLVAKCNADLERELEDLVGSIGIEAAIRKLQGD